MCGGTYPQRAAGAPSNATKNQTQACMLACASCCQARGALEKSSRKLLAEAWVPPSALLKLPPQTRICAQPRGGHEHVDDACCRGCAVARWWIRLCIVGAAPAAQGQRTPIREDWSVEKVPDHNHLCMHACIWAQSCKASGPAGWGGGEEIESLWFMGKAEDRGRTG